jgi:D-alanine-D-alanine ligase
MCPDAEHSAGGAAGPRKLRVTVLCGGPSAEREISLQSGEAVAAGLRAAGHEVYVGDIRPEDLSALDHPADVVFPALHGTFGEDGTLQRILEGRRIPYVGSDSAASAIAMDKVRTKEIARSIGLATPDYEVWDRDRLGASPQTALPLPVVVKPVDQGSSVGTWLVREPGEFEDAVNDAIGRFGRALVERFVAGHELTVGIVGDRELPPIRIQPKRAFYDFTAKYQDETTEYLLDTGHPPELLDRLQRDSRRIYSEVGCRHLSRIDWLIDDNSEAWLLEINTLPGFTSHSLVPKGAAAVGISFEALVDWLVRMAREDAS